MLVTGGTSGLGHAWHTRAGPDTTAGAGVPDLRWLRGNCVRHAIDGQGDQKLRSGHARPTFTDDQITMVDSAGNVKAQPGSLNSAGNSFPDTWKRST